MFFWITVISKLFQHLLSKQRSADIINARAEYVTTCIWRSRCRVIESKEMSVMHIQKFRRKGLRNKRGSSMPNVILITSNELHWGRKCMNVHIFTLWRTTFISFVLQNWESTDGWHGLTCILRNAFWRTLISKEHQGCVMADAGFMQQHQPLATFYHILTVKRLSVNPAK